MDSRLFLYVMTVLVVIFFVIPAVDAILTPEGLKGYGP